MAVCHGKYMVIEGQTSHGWIILGIIEVEEPKGQFQLRCKCLACDLALVDMNQMHVLSVDFEAHITRHKGRLLSDGAYQLNGEWRRNIDPKEGDPK